MPDSLERLYRTKLTLLGTLLVTAGLAALVFAQWETHVAELHWLSTWPITDIGSGLFTTGLLGVAIQYFDAADSETRATQRLQHVLADSAPAMRDAVISGFAFEPTELARVATTETLDKIVTNGLGIRLADPEFAQEIYRDLGRQAINVAERLSDARVSIRLATDARTPRGHAPRFSTTVRWEFTVIPHHQTRRFVSLSDRAEFRELGDPDGSTSAWLINPRPGLDAGSREAFELLSFSVDGRNRPIRRTTRTGGQAYTVNVGKDVIEAGLPVTVAYTYRTLTSQQGHLLQLRVDQPTRGLDVELDYSDTDLKAVTVLDFIASGDRARVSTGAELLATRTVAWISTAGCSHVPGLPSSGERVTNHSGTRSPLRLLRLGAPRQAVGARPVSESQVRPVGHGGWPNLRTYPGVDVPMGAAAPHGGRL